MRKNRERKLNGTYFVKSSFLLDLIRFNRSGTVWHSRFKSILLKVKENVERFIKIINELPVKLKLCIAKGEYQFSGLYHTKNRIKTIIK